MAFDEQLGARIREYLASRPGFSEKKMFGGLCFLLNGHMCCGINDQDLMLRVGPGLYDEILARDGARPMDFTGRALKGMIYVGPSHLKTARALNAWVDTAVGFVETLAPKVPKQKKAPNPNKAQRKGPEPAASFAGFSGTTTRFLRDLAANNDKAWFDANRADYEVAFVEPAQAFVRAIAPSLKRLSKTIQCEPRINGSIFRINRDVRFSKDKTPYKPHLDFTFWEGARGFTTPSLFLRVAPKQLVIGGGIHDFGPSSEVFRAAIDDARRGAALAKVLDALSATYGVSEPALKRVPRGFDPDHPRAELLRCKGLTATLETRPPPELGTDEFIDWCVRHYRAFMPLHKWLLRALTIKS